MSSATKSSKSASRFGVGDIQDIFPPKSVKKELAAGQSIPKGKGISTWARKFASIQILQGQHLADAEEHILDLQTMAAAKDKMIAHLEKENKALKKQVLLAEITDNKALNGQETVDSSFNRAEWDIAAWRQRLHELRDDEDAEELLTIEAGGSGDKDPVDVSEAGGSCEGGEGGEDKVDDAAKA
ncbi:hypothetical protein Hanom_Chr07g00643891 [Helianthus anomalus]